MTRIVIPVGAVCIHLAISSVAWAQPKLPFAPTDQEVLMLPQECKGRLRGDPATVSYYAQLFPGLAGLHHYCFGLNFINRAKLEMNKTEKRFNLQSAIGEFDYVLKHSAPNAKGLQQVQAQKEMAELMLKSL